jgi:hypothetical protein
MSPSSTSSGGLFGRDLGVRSVDALLDLDHDNAHIAR